MFSQIVTTIRIFCVAATIMLAVVLILCFWGFKIVEWDTFWKLFASYLALMGAGTLICYIDDPKRISGR